MHPKLRTCIVYVAGRLITGRDASSIYDDSRAKNISIAGTVTPEKIDVFDRDRGCYLSGLGEDVYDPKLNRKSGGLFRIEENTSTAEARCKPGINPDHLFVGGKRLFIVQTPEVSTIRRWSPFFSGRDAPHRKIRFIRSQANTVLTTSFAFL